jgi:hypothetical protein
MHPVDAPAIGRVDHYGSQGLVSSLPYWVGRAGEVLRRKEHPATGPGSGQENGDS